MQVLQESLAQYVLTLTVPSTLQLQCMSSCLCQDRTLLIDTCLACSKNYIDKGHWVKCQECAVRVIEHYKSKVYRALSEEDRFGEGFVLISGNKSIGDTS
jgi:DNA-directed RNA polymerase subunit RPC12/RpoP